jgi:hypothetical protein
VNCKNIGEDGTCLKSRNSPSYHPSEMTIEPIKCPYNGNIQECLNYLIDVGIEHDKGWRCFLTTRISIREYEKERTLTSERQKTTS